MRLNWVPYRGRDFASCGAFLRNTLRKAWQRHFDEEFLGKGAACGESVDADMEDPWYLVKKDVVPFYEIL